MASLECRRAVLETRRAGLAAKERARAEWFRRHEAALEERRALRTDEVLRARERVAEWRRAMEGIEMDRCRLERSGTSRSLGRSIGR